MKLLLDENLSRRLVPFADFQELSLVWGPPPQVIWLKTKNLSRAATLKILLDNKQQIQESLLVHEMACVEVS